MRTATSFIGTDYVFIPGKADWLRRGTEATIVTYGALTPAAMEAWSMLLDREISAGVLNMASLLPLDEESLLEAASIGPLVIAEDHHIGTGLSASAAVALADRPSQVKMKRFGVSRYGSPGKPAELYAGMGLDAYSMAAAAREIVVSEK